MHLPSIYQAHDEETGFCVLPEAPSERSPGDLCRGRCGPTYTNPQIG